MIYPPMSSNISNISRGKSLNWMTNWRFIGLAKSTYKWDIFQQATFDYRVSGKRPAKTWLWPGTHGIQPVNMVIVLCENGGISHFRNENFTIQSLMFSHFSPQNAFFLIQFGWGSSLFRWIPKRFSGSQAPLGGVEHQKVCPGFRSGILISIWTDVCCFFCLT